ncbi:MAG: hypothetical protein OEY29_05360 [Gammaproteobacteria bacterium]|nr:hypothetical protein [Gammaproteobacteria bacterium]
MRNIFLVLLAANVTVYLLYFYGPENGEKPKAALPENVTKLVLLSEVDKASLTPEKNAEESDVVEEVKVADVVVDKKCYTIGPFREESEIEGFKTKIKSKVKEIGIRERIEKEHWRYLVYLPNKGTKEKAVKMAADLARKGMKDYYVIARGEYKNSISLGHFKDKLLAEKRLNAITQMSYKPKIQAIEKEYTLFWLDYVANDQNGLSSKTLEGFELEDSIHQFKRECAK